MECPTKPGCTYMHGKLELSELDLMVPSHARKAWGNLGRVIFPIEC